MNRNLSTDPTWEPKATKSLREKKINIKEAILKKLKDPFAKIIVDNYVKQFHTTPPTVEEVIAELKKEGHSIKLGESGAGLDKAQTDYFLENYKNKSLTRMAKDFSGKKASAKTIKNAYERFKYMRTYALENKIINLKDAFVDKGPPRKFKTPLWKTF